MKIHYCMFIEHQPHRNHENDPELNCISQEGTSATGDYHGKQ